MRFQIPPHIAWPSLVIFILGIGISSVTYTVYQAQKDGGVAMVDDYYAQAADWDALASARGAAENWSGTISWSEDTPPRLLLDLQNAEGEPVSVDDGTIALRQPHQAKPFFETGLSEAEPGRYVHTVPVLNNGLWDATVRGTVNDSPVEYTVRFEHSR